jgi:hypothetical protein
MHCTKSKFNILWTHAKISDALLLFEAGIKYIEVQFNGKVVAVKLDGETSFSNKFYDFVIEKGYKVERLAPDT